MLSEQPPEDCTDYGTIEEEVHPAAMAGDPTIRPTIAHMGTLPPSGVGALIICVIRPSTTPTNRPATTDALSQSSLIPILQLFTAI